MDYKLKLEQFNSTRKYSEEMLFLKQQLSVHHGDRVLDYGCGIGTMVKALQRAYNAHIIGFDVNKYFEEATDQLPEQVNKVYFMHSIAHIPDVMDALKRLHPIVSGHVHVITPNLEWIHANINENYTPDPTVYKHYTQNELYGLFQDCGYTVEICAAFGTQSGSINERIYLRARK